jgi:P-type Cu+ transporter
MSKDPVCGMTVEEQRAAGTAEHGGARYYFCGKSCAEKFKADPETYVSRTADTPSAEISLRAADTSAHPTESRVEYTCPMHPEIVRYKQGSCPICGMALEPREVTGEETNPELDDMKRRFWISVALTIPLLVPMILDWLPGLSGNNWISRGAGWVELLLAMLVCAVGRLAFF